ncbi:MAG: hypothetical protein HC869_01105 [Rhodospirillales bacterium]|nr:hypothetical protein [Rhodospirillales bacterium]
MLVFAAAASLVPSAHAQEQAQTPRPPAPELTEGAIATPGVSIRRRLDGGLNVAYSGRGTFDLTPDAFRYARMFWATYKQRGGKLKIRFGRPFFEA